ncbi:competence/damage-inducible protein A [Alkalihalobacillus trypoxylicola]|uniref:Putative competence-damage inducible protein n=1 Tax=Alkalihalobacillus trypoxylicola TaxID=519424 RepID=A0A162F7T8_9BACI|nr:competence/damage-inducible protein A [Alkalihalobacillus trypoxylicola]KYG34991.1 competence/damage-inducible protein A [Alkalihalobacillus trypoxylicola]
MRAEIIAVGSELLLGQILNTNARFLSKELALLGIDNYYQSVVGDNALRLKEVLETAKKRSDFIILTGGLGPTKDDLTKETVAELFQTGLSYNEDALTSIESFFTKRNRVMTENNKKQALVLKHSKVLENHFGMAPGMLLEKDQKMIALLPGPPKEMEPMFLNQLKPLLELKMNHQATLTTRVLRFFNIGEAELETKVLDLIEAQSNPTIAPLAGDGEVTLRLTVKHKDANMAKLLLDETEAKITERVGDYLYGYDHTSLKEQLFLQLKKQNLTISAAESLTGGLFSGALTDFPGSSEVFIGSIVAYSTNVKEYHLQVSKEIIDGVGVVSEEAALAMAQSVKEKFGSDIGISFTGVAGPNKQENKEVGTVFIGIVGKEKEQSVTYRLQLHHTRQAIRERTIKYGCFYLLNELKRWNRKE